MGVGFNTDEEWYGAILKLGYRFTPSHQLTLGFHSFRSDCSYYYDDSDDSGYCGGYGSDELIGPYLMYTYSSWFSYNWLFIDLGGGFGAAGGFLKVGGGLRLGGFTFGTDLMVMDKGPFPITGFSYTF